MSKKTSTRDEAAIAADRQAAIDEYVANRDVWTAPEIAAYNARFRELNAEWSACLSSGANACQECGNPPMGMIKTPAFTKDGVDFPCVYEVGCIFCDPYLVERENGQAREIDGRTLKLKRRSFSARGVSVAQAVENWNSGRWVEDLYFERTPQAVLRAE